MHDTERMNVYHLMAGNNNTIQQDVFIVTRRVKSQWSTVRF